jgi:hypothetical protein
MTWAELPEEDRERIRARWQEERHVRRRQQTAERVRRHRARTADQEGEEIDHKAGRLLRLPQMDRSWLDRAACHGMDPLLFWHPTERRNANPGITDIQLLRDQRTAARTCAGCPVQRDCYADGLTTKAAGIWGGRLLGPDREQPINLISRLHEGRLYRKEQAA